MHARVRALREQANSQEADIRYLCEQALVPVSSVFDDPTSSTGSDSREKGMSPATPSARDARTVFKDPLKAVPSWTDLEGNVTVLYNLAGVWGARVALLETVVHEQAREIEDRRNDDLACDKIFYKELVRRVVDEPLVVVADLSRIQQAYGAAACARVLPVSSDIDSSRGESKRRIDFDHALPVQRHSTIDKDRHQERCPQSPPSAATNDDYKGSHYGAGLTTEALLRVALMTAAAQKLAGIVWFG
eukprot:FR738947.1.p1 GENE.FR738947.1~~FR738947.1.p1  ORF type:complete len:274 (+),score=23.99 FR738947.1:85-822(+)